MKQNQKSKIKYGDMPEKPMFKIMGVNYLRERNLTCHNCGQVALSHTGDSFTYKHVTRELGEALRANGYDGHLGNAEMVREDILLCQSCYTCTSLVMVFLNWATLILTYPYKYRSFQEKEESSAARIRRKAAGREAADRRRKLQECMIDDLSNEDINKVIRAHKERVKQKRMSEIRMKLVDSEVEFTLPNKRQISISEIIDVLQVVSRDGAATEIFNSVLISQAEADAENSLDKKACEEKASKTIEAANDLMRSR